MKITIPDSFTNRRSTRLLIGGIITIFLGAIGSGLWELFLGPLLSKLSDVVLSALSSIFHGYIDTIYRQVSKNPADYLSLLPYAVILGFTISMPWVALSYLLYSMKRLLKEIRNPAHENVKSPEEQIAKLGRMRRTMILIVLPLNLITTIVYSQEFFQTLHSRKAALFMERSIEILSPHIDDHARLELRAELRAIENARDFYQLEDKLRGIAKENSVKLPEFKSIR